MFVRSFGNLVQNGDGLRGVTITMYQISREIGGSVRNVVENKNQALFSCVSVYRGVL